MRVVRGFISAILTGVFMLGLSGPAMAGAAPAPTTCDPTFMDVLENRAWMEGKREMEIAQRLMLKPDSVLEYSCFNIRLNELQTQSRTILNMPRGFIWMPMVGRDVGPGINRLARDSLVNYVDNNFQHSPLGGLMPDGGGTNCSVMNDVWNFLRCAEYDEGSFITLRQIVTNRTDVRTRPQVCSEPNRPVKWQNANNAAFPPPAVPAARGGMDATATFLQSLDPDNCDDIRPIPTGLIVRDIISGSTATSQYPDMVCPAAACFYDAAQAMGGGRCVASP
jgi:hypothetical protein